MSLFLCLGAALVWIVYHSKVTSVLSSEDTSEQLVQDLHTFSLHPISTDEQLSRTPSNKTSLIFAARFNETRSDAQLLELLNPSSTMMPELSGSVPSKLQMKYGDSFSSVNKQRFTELHSIYRTAIPLKVSNTMPNFSMANHYQSSQNITVEHINNEFSESKTSTTFVDIGLFSIRNATIKTLSTLPVVSLAQRYNWAPITSHVSSTVTKPSNLFSEKNSFAMSDNAEQVTAVTALQRLTERFEKQLASFYKTFITRLPVTEIHKTYTSFADLTPIKSASSSSPMTPQSLKLFTSTLPLQETTGNPVTMANDTSGFLKSKSSLFRTKLPYLSNSDELTTVKFGLTRPKSTYRPHTTKIRVRKLPGSTGFPVPSPSMLKSHLFSAQRRIGSRRICARLDRRFRICWMDVATRKFSNSCSKVVSSIKGNMLANKQRLNIFSSLKLYFKEQIRLLTIFKRNLKLDLIVYL